MDRMRRDLLKAVAASAALPLLRPAVADAAETTGRAEQMGPEKFVSVDGIRTRYFEGGSGMPLVLIHGGQWPATTSAEGWAPIFDRLAQHYHVYAFDKLGMGFTDNPKRDEDYSMDAVVRHAEGFIAAVGIKRGVVVGHSRGALPAARIATDHPDLVSHLVILDSNALASDDIKLSERPDPPAREAPPTAEEIRKSLLASPLYYKKDFVTDAYVAAELRIATQPKILEASRKFTELRDKWVRAHPEEVKKNPLIGNNMGSVVWWMIDCKHETMDRIRAGKLKAPVTIIWGWNDPFAPLSLGLSTMETIAKVVPDTAMHIVNHASHLLFSDQPEEVARLIVESVKRT